MATKVFVVVTSGDKEVVNWPSLGYPFYVTINKWMDKVKMILFGPSEELTANDSEIQVKLKELQDVGIEVIACKACADEWDITDKLEKTGCDV
ncbi:DsrE family protein [Chloroflexota bacterium]